MCSSSCCCGGGGRDERHVTTNNTTTTATSTWNATTYCCQSGRYYGHDVCGPPSDIRCIIQSRAVMSMQLFAQEDDTLHQFVERGDCKYGVSSTWWCSSLKARQLVAVGMHFGMASLCANPLLLHITTAPQAEKHDVAVISANFGDQWRFGIPLSCSIV